MTDPTQPEDVYEDIVPEPGLGGVFDVVEHIPPESGPTLKTRSYDLKRHLAVTRSWLAGGIIGVAILTTAGTIIAHVAGAMDTPTFSSTMSGLSGLQALAGAVVGFYFGSNKSD